jgi:hypothetical protein
MDKFGGRTAHISTETVHPETLEPWHEAVGLERAVKFARLFHGDQKSLESADLPLAVVVAKARKAFPDMWHAQDKLLIISQALRDIIEALDPGTHKIWPVAMMTKRGDRYPGPFFGFMPMVHAAAISEKHGDVMISEEKFYPATPVVAEHVSPRTTTLGRRNAGFVYSSKLPDAHIWWDHGLTTNYLLISDALHGAFKDAKLKTLHFEKLSPVPETDDV